MISNNLQKELDCENEDGFEFVFSDIGKSRSFADSERTTAYRDRYLWAQQTNSRLPKTPPHYWDERLRLHADASELLHARGAYAQHYQVYQNEVLGEAEQTEETGVVKQPVRVLKPSTVTLTGAAVFRNWNQANESRFQTDSAYQQWIMETVNAELPYYVQLSREGITRQDLFHRVIELPPGKKPILKKKGTAANDTEGDDMDDMRRSPVGIIKPLPRLTYGLDITMANKGLVLLANMTGLPPVWVIEWINARPACAGFVCTYEVTQSKAQRAKYCTDFDTISHGYYHRREALDSLFRDKARTEKIRPIMYGFVPAGATKYEI